MKKTIAFGAPELLPITSMTIEYIFPYTLVESSLIGLPEEKSRTLQYNIKVGCTFSLAISWGLNLPQGDYLNEDFIKVLFEYGKRHIIQKLKEGVLSKEEEIILNTSNTETPCIFDPSRIDPPKNDHIEVELGEEQIIQNAEIESLFAKLEEMGEDLVRLKLAQGVFAPQRKRDLVSLWLYNKEKAQSKVEKAIPKTQERFIITFDSAKAWGGIKKDYDISKKTFAKKINFVSDSFKRKIIFRDIEQAYILSNSGFSKPSVVLAGSVIEELLRIYLEHKNIKPNKNTFDSYIQACEDNGLLKSAIHRLTDSVRHFRNIVHLEKEVSSRETISKVTAKGAVSSIFIIANDF